MRNRFLALVAGAVLMVSLSGCSKKEAPQTAQTPPATTDQSAQQAQQMPPAPGAGQQVATTTPGGQPAGANTVPPPPAPMEAAKPEPPPPPPPLVVPAGTSLMVRLGTALDTKTAQDGQGFNGTLARSVVVKNEVAIPAGAAVSGTVVESKSPGRFKGEGLLSITLNAINVGGAPMQIATSTFTQTIKGKGKRTAVAVGGGTGAGALIGGLAGGGKGAAIGALVGAGAGTAGAAFTGNKEVVIPAETAVTFRLANSITVPHTGKKVKATEEPAQ